MHNTTYHKARNAADAASLLSGAEDGTLLAGGQTLIPTMKARLAAPTDLVDVSGASDMRGIIVSGNRVTIGAATTHAEVAGSSEIRAVCPSICDLAANIGDPAVRNRGTIGGSVANNDPAADYPAAMLALGATIQTNTREIAADEFFTGMFDTALDEGEIITGVSFTAPAKGAYAKFPNPASRYAMCGVFVASGDAGTRVAITGAGSDGVFRATDMEAALNSNFSASALDGLSVDAANMLSDIHGDSAYRANLVKVMAKRAVTGAG
ncbi:xanthine dehydrogenase family protein subunit M [Rhodobacteraceae bacterium]|nr:xanthine dehydrogenase family protein subunit M [Paracoccaceae bacterium]